MSTASFLADFAYEAGIPTPDFFKSRSPVLDKLHSRKKETFNFPFAVCFGFLCMQASRDASTRFEKMADEYEERMFSPATRRTHKWWLPWNLQLGSQSQGSKLNSSKVRRGLRPGSVFFMSKLEVPCTCSPQKKQRPKKCLGSGHDIPPTLAANPTADKHKIYQDIVEFNFKTLGPRLKRCPGPLHEDLGCWLLAAGHVFTSSSTCCGCCMHITD